MTKTFHDNFQDYKQKHLKYFDLFQKTFGVSLTKFSNLTTSMFGIGFDLMKFDDWLNVPDGVSTKNYVIEKYGQDACDMLMDLAGISEDKENQTTKRKRKKKPKKQN